MSSTEARGQTSTLQAAFTIVTTIIGAGILGFPRTFATGGWFWSSLILVLVALSVVEIGYVIDRAVHFVELHLIRGEEFSFVRPTRYENLCEVAFGTIGKAVAGIMVNTFMLMIGGVFIILISLQLKFLAHPTDLGDWAVYGIAILFAPLSLLDDMRIIANMSVIGVVASVIYAVTIGTAGYQAGQVACEQEHMVFLPVSRLGELGPVVSVILSGYSYQMVAPNIRAEMAEPRQFPRAVAGAVAVCTLVYFAASSFAYWGWGNAVEGQVVSSMFYFTEDCEKGERMVLGIVLASAIVANLVVTFPIIMNVVYRSAEAAMGVQYSPFGMSSIIRVGLVTVALLIGRYLPFFFPFLTLMGGTVGGIVAIFLPLALFWKLAGEEGITLKTHPGTAAKHTFIVLLGLVSLVFGTYGAIQEFIQEFEKARGNSTATALIW